MREKVNISTRDGDSLMEIESDNGDNICLELNSPTVLGRGFGLHTNDRTVSRRHISLELQAQQISELIVSLEAVGKNPVWVRKGDTGEVEVYRKGEGCEIYSGDVFSVYGKKHVWFRLKGAVGEDEDVSEIDPVKELGFVVMGHEFDSYSKKLLHPKNWNWFLEEPKMESDDENDIGLASNSRRRKKKKGKHTDLGDDDDEWEGESESEEDKELILKTKNVPRPTYSTRSKDCGILTKTRINGNGKFKPHRFKSCSEDEKGNADDDDETLGGFIVDDEEMIDDEVGDEDGEEEEEFEDEDEDVALQILINNVTQIMPRK